MGERASIILEITKSNRLPTMVQNFAAISWQSSENSKTTGKNNKHQQDRSPLRKLPFPGELISAGVENVKCWLLIWRCV